MTACEKYITYMKQEYKEQGLILGIARARQKIAISDDFIRIYIHGYIVG